MRARDGSVRAWTLLDGEDAELARFRWSLDGRYAARKDGSHGKPVTVRLHRAVMGLDPGDKRQVDHINGDGLDNRRANLRIVTAAQNAQNRPANLGRTSKHRGVSWNTARGEWRAHAALDYKFIHLGCFDNETAAAEAATTYRLDSMTHTNESRD